MPCVRLGGKFVCLCVCYMYQNVSDDVSPPTNLASDLSKKYAISCHKLCICDFRNRPICCVMPRQPPKNIAFE